jgi:simple sugar transport system permease protein
MKDRLLRLTEVIGRPLVALVIALVIGGLVIALTQRDVGAPFAAYGALVSGAIGNGVAWAGTLSRTMPLLLTGLAVVVALAAGLFNIGAEGQLAVGGLAAAWVGFALADILAAPLLLLLSLLASLAGGALWALLPVLLRVTRGAHEVITAILLNYVAANTTRYLATVPLKDPAGSVPQTPEVGAVLAPARARLRRSCRAGDCASCVLSLWPLPAEYRFGAMRRGRPAKARARPRRPA